MPVRKMTAAAIIAAAYIVLTLPFGTVAFGPIQFRAAEALTLLPFIAPSSIYGVFIGCFVSNILFSTPPDAVIGSLATLIAAYLTYKSKNVFTAALAPVIVNSVVIGSMLCVISGTFSIELLVGYIFSIGISQAIICFGGGIPLIKLLKKYRVDRLINK